MINDRKSRDRGGALRVCLMLGLVFVLATGLAACGRKGGLEKPAGSTYPKEYPTE